MYVNEGDTVKKGDLIAEFEPTMGQGDGARLTEKATKDMQKYAEIAFRALGLTTYARMDFLMDENENIYCLEANTLPGMTPTSLLPQEAGVVGMNFEDLCEHLIEVSLKKYA